MQVQLNGSTVLTLIILSIKCSFVSVLTEKYSNRNTVMVKYYPDNRQHRRNMQFSIMCWYYPVDTVKELK